MLVPCDGLIFGSPTYLAAGFAVPSLPSGDKQSTLTSMFVFGMQHGTLWVGNPFLPEQHQGVAYGDAVNRLGSWSGLMAQAGHGSPAGSFVAGDIKTARMFGQHFAETVSRMCSTTHRPPRCFTVGWPWSREGMSISD